MDTVPSSWFSLPCHAYCLAFWFTLPTHPTPHPCPQHLLGSLVPLPPYTCPLCSSPPTTTYLPLPFYPSFLLQVWFYLPPFLPPYISAYDTLYCSFLPYLPPPIHNLPSPYVCACYLSPSTCLPLHTLLHTTFYTTTQNILPSLPTYTHTLYLYQLPLQPFFPTVLPATTCYLHTHLHTHTTPPPPLHTHRQILPALTWTHYLPTCLPFCLVEGTLHVSPSHFCLFPSSLHLRGTTPVYLG